MSFSSRCPILLITLVTQMHWIGGQHEDTSASCLRRDKHTDECLEREVEPHAHGEVAKQSAAHPSTVQVVLFEHVGGGAGHVRRRQVGDPDIGGLALHMRRRLEVTHSTIAAILPWRTATAAAVGSAVRKRGALGDPDREVELQRHGLGDIGATAVAGGVLLLTLSLHKDLDGPIPDGAVDADQRGLRKTTLFAGLEGVADGLLGGLGLHVWVADATGVAFDPVGLDTGVVLARVGAQAVQVALTVRAPISPVVADECQQQADEEGRDSSQVFHGTILRSVMHYAQVRRRPR